MFFNPWFFILADKGFHLKRKTFQKTKKIIFCLFSSHLFIFQPWYQNFCCQKVFLMKNILFLSSHLNTIKVSRSIASRERAGTVLRNGKVLLQFFSTSTYIMLVSVGSSGMSFNCWRTQRTVRCWHEHLSGHFMALTPFKSATLHNAISKTDNFLFTSFIFARCLMISTLECTTSSLSRFSSHSLLTWFN